MHILDWFSCIRIEAPAWLICFIRLWLQLTADISCLWNTECPSSSSVSSLNCYTETSRPFPRSSSSSTTVCTTFICFTATGDMSHLWNNTLYLYCHTTTLCKRSSLYFRLILIHFSPGEGCWCVMPEENIILSFQGDIVIWCKVPITRGGLRCHSAILELCKVHQLLMAEWSAKSMGNIRGRRICPLNFSHVLWDRI